MGRNKKPSGAKAPKLKDVRSADAIQAFAKLGFNRDRQVGSHVMLVKPGHPYTLSIPTPGIVTPGILKQCIAAAGITGEEFAKLL